MRREVELLLEGTGRTDDRILMVQIERVEGEGNVGVVGGLTGGMLEAGGGVVLERETVGFDLRFGLEIVRKHHGANGGNGG
jgi:hypothetical protein